MRNGTFFLTAASVAALLAVSVLTARVAAQEKQYPIFGVDQFVASMKTAGLAFTAVNKSIADGSAEDAKAYLVIARERVATTITYWRQQRKDDAVTMLRDTLTKLDALDTALSAAKMDRAAVSAAVQQVQGSCQACHTAYREQDAQTKAYRIKPLGIAAK